MLYRWRQKIIALIRAPRDPAEISDELSFHIEQATQRNIRAGMRPDEARMHAARTFGAFDRYAEEAREHERGNPALLMDAVRLATGQGARSLLRSPSFTLATVLTFAVGIGATTAVFSVIDSALLKPLPYPTAARAVAIQQARNGEEISVSWPDFLDLRARSHSFDAVAAFTGWSVTLTGRAEPERLRGQLVTSNLFSVLGVTPAAGHAFTPRDDEPGGEKAVTLSYALWQRDFGGDASIVGRRITLDGEPFTVRAVMPAGFRFPDGMVYGAADLWLPMGLLENADRQNRDSHPGLAAIGLLKGGTTVADARADLDRVAAELAKEYPVSNKLVGFKTDRAIDVVVGSLGSSLILLFGAAALVLLIACANIGGLMLTRGEAHRREASIKAALGASAVRIAANEIAEACLIALAGGIGGTLLAAALVRLFAPSLAGFPRLDTLSVSPRMLGFSLSLTFVAALAFGMVPVFAARKLDVERWLRSRGGTAARGTVSKRSVLVGGQIALSAVLLITAALLLRTFQHLRADNGGIDPTNAMTFTLQIPGSIYSDDGRASAYYDAVLARIATVPGVKAAGAISVLPFSGYGAQSGIAPAGSGRDVAKRTDVSTVTPGYLRSIGMQLVLGRWIADEDRAASTPVAVIDEQTAAAFWPRQNPIGKHVEGWGSTDREVVGVVRHVTNYGVAAESRQEMFVPETQHALHRMSVVVRGTTDVNALMPSIRAAVHDVDDDIPLSQVRTMADVVGTTLSGPRLAAFLTLCYASTALLLALIGMYGAMSYIVNRRRREIGVRIALGARPAGIFGTVLFYATRVAAGGLVIGVAAAVVLSRVTASMLFGVSPNDVPIFAGCASVLLAAAIAAAAFPAWRASRVAAVIALSED